MGAIRVLTPEPFFIISIDGDEVSQTDSNKLSEFYVKKGKRRVLALKETEDYILMYKRDIFVQSGKLFVLNIGAEEIEKTESKNKIIKGMNIQASKDRDVVYRDFKVAVFERGISFLMRKKYQNSVPFSSLKACYEQSKKEPLLKEFRKGGLMWKNRNKILEFAKFARSDQGFKYLSEKAILSVNSKSFQLSSKLREAYKDSTAEKENRYPYYSLEGNNSDKYSKEYFYDIRLNSEISTYRDDLFKIMNKDSKKLTMWFSRREADLFYPSTTWCNDLQIEAKKAYSMIENLWRQSFP